MAPVQCDDCRKIFVSEEEHAEYHHGRGDLDRHGKSKARPFVERHAGKLLIIAFAGPIPLRLASTAAGSVALSWLADLLWVGFVVSAVIGYVQRRR